MDTSVIDIKTTLRGSVPRIPFADIAAAILGHDFELSLVICGDTLARKMYEEYRLPSLKLRRARKKTYSPNVLSFPLSKNEGEIFLNVRCAAREALPAGRQGAHSVWTSAERNKVRSRIAYLFIHGCFHLKGLDHGNKMEKEESRIMRRFKLTK